MSVSQLNSKGLLLPPEISWKPFTELSSKESDCVLEWRNHPDICKWMRNPKPIHIEEHQTFLATLQRATDKGYYLLYQKGKAFGVADVYAISNKTSSCYYGYYLNPDLLGTSFGILMEFWVAEIALMSMNLKRLIAETKPENHSANELHAYFGFAPKGLNADGLIEAELEQKVWETKRHSIQALVSRFFASQD